MVRATPSPSRAFGPGLAHLPELGPFGEDLRPPLVGHDGGLRSGSRLVQVGVTTGSGDR